MEVGCLTYFRQLLSDDAHPLKVLSGVVQLFHLRIYIVPLVDLLAEVIARDVVPTYRGHRKARASYVIDLV